MSTALAEAARGAANGAPAAARSDKDKPVDIQRLEGAKSAIALAIPATSNLEAERFIRVMSTEIQKNPKLNEATRESLLGSFLECAALGLEPGPLGLASIVPFSNRKKLPNGEWITEVEAQLIIEYRGFIELGYRSGLLKSVALGVARQGDNYRHWTDEHGEHLMYEQLVDEDAEVREYFGVFVLTTGGSVISTLLPGQVEKFRKRSSSQRVYDQQSRSYSVSEKPLGAWASDYEAMALKTVVRRAENKLPKSTEMQRAFAADERVVVNRGVEASASKTDNVIEVEGWEDSEAGVNTPTGVGEGGEGSSRPVDPPAPASESPGRALNSEEKNQLLDALRDAGVTVAAEQNKLISDAIGRQVRGVTSLTISEAHKVVGALEARASGDGTPVSEPATDASDPDADATDDTLASLRADIAAHGIPEGSIEAYIDSVVGPARPITNADVLLVRSEIAAEKQQEAAAAPSDDAPFA